MATLRITCGLRLAGSSHGITFRKACPVPLVPLMKPAGQIAACNSTAFTSQRLRRNQATSTARRPFICMAGNLADMITEKNKSNTVVVYSKTYCPFCMEVKGLFKSLGAKPTVVELDELADGDDVQGALYSVTGSRTVPQVFIGGEFIGGCDDTMAAQRSGKLAEVLEAAGVSVNSA